jgi:hypothetical protein
MTNLAEAIFEKVRELDPLQQQQVLAFVQNLQHPSFDYAGWQKQIEQIHAELRAMYGEDYRIDGQTLLDEVREEAS